MIDLLARRRAMMGASGARPKVAKGSWTQGSSMNGSHIVEHNLGTTNVIVVWRNTNPRWDNVTGAMGGWAIADITRFNTYINSSRVAVGCFLNEARSNGTQYNFTTILSVDVYTSNEITILARNTSYGFIPYDTYEWVAVSLDNPDVESSVTLDASTASYDYTHNLDSLDVIGVMWRDTAEYGVNVCDASFYAPEFFKMFSGIKGITLESRTNFGSYTGLYGLPDTSYTANSLTFKGRSNTYPFLAGDHTIKCTKY